LEPDDLDFADLEAGLDVDELLVDLFVEELDECCAAAS
jgi:hypothetical protein